MERDGFVRLCISVQDSVHDNIMQYMDECLEFVNNALNDGKILLVHCWMGASRSVSIIIGYLVQYQQMRLKDCLNHIAKVRGAFARPNTAFILQLIAMEKQLFDCNSYCVSPKQMQRYYRKIRKISS